MLRLLWFVTTQGPSISFKTLDTRGYGRSHAIVVYAFDGMCRRLNVDLQPLKYLLRCDGSTLKIQNTYLQKESMKLKNCSQSLR